MTNDELDQAISMWRCVDDIVLTLQKMGNKHADDMDVFLREKFEHLTADSLALRRDLLSRMSERLNVG